MDGVVARISVIVIGLALDLRQGFGLRLLIYDRRFWLFMIGVMRMNWVTVMGYE